MLNPFRSAGPIDNLLRGEPVWTIDEALTFLEKLWKKLLPRYHVALTGSVLYKGYSRKDLDVLVYGHGSTTVDVEDFRDLLTLSGLDLRHAPELVRYAGYKDLEPECRTNPRLLDVWKVGRDRKRVDFIFIGPTVNVSTSVYNRNGVYPPGSFEAVKAGCSCPRIDNRNGLGRHDGTFLIHGLCGLHT